MPLVIEWVDRTLAAHWGQAQPATSFGLSRLSRFYSCELLAEAKVVVLPRVPVPPLGKMGLGAFSQFESLDSLGITFKNIYFVRQSHASDESLHFHELVHVAQWKHLGTERFLLGYAQGLATHGYHDSPLERMAYELQERFDAGAASIDVESLVRVQLNRSGL